MCGSSVDLPKEAIPFCLAVGAELALDEKVVIVSGGTRKRKGFGEDNLAADWHMVSAAERAIRERSGAGAVNDRIETVLGDETSSSPGESFHIGTLHRARGKTREARRFSFVRSLDGLFAVAGGSGTAQELALAMELGIPLLPVPIFDGTAAEFWRSYESDLIPMLRIEKDRVQRWRSQSADINAVAVDMVKVLLQSLPRRCFVIMPFGADYVTLYDFVIGPALESLGDHPIRLDRSSVPGDAAAQIREGIKHCDYAIAVLDGLRSNVLYELGLAHGCAKPTVLLNRAGTLGDSDLAPFDLSMHQRLEYQTLDAALLERLKESVATMFVRRR